MGLETTLILFGIIGEAASDDGTKFHHVAETCLTIGLVMAGIELAIVVLFFVLAVLGVRR